MSEWVEGRITGRKHWTDLLYSLQIDAPVEGFKAGQYINILLDDGQRRAFSFANPPHQPELIELQIRLVPGGRFTTHVFEGLREGDELRFDGPLGDFTLRESERRIVFVAGATG